jgi:crotonobetainyl-CoA:carnitine CoA-transferase CaiB-like acyl-CoA transferase
MVTRAEVSDGLLAGLRVVEIGRRIAAPVVGMVLAEQGAEVIRVVDEGEQPLDPVLDALLARGKTELRLDLGTGDGRSALNRLVARADAVVENRGLADLGIDLDRLRDDRAPGLVSCSIPGFPAGHPLSDLPDYEAVVGTAAYLYEKPIGMPQVHAFPLGSALAGLFAANGVVAALIARHRTGRGQHVDVSLFDSDVFAQVVLVLMRTGIPRGFLPLKMVGTPFMGSWLCGDGRYIYLHISLPAHNARILEILEENGYPGEVRELRGILSEETIADPSQVKSIPEAKAIREVYERIFQTRGAREWEEVLGGELCCIQVRTVEEWVEDSLQAGMADSCIVDDPVFGELMAPGAAVTLAEYPPLLGARTPTEDLDGLLDRWEKTAPKETPPSEDRTLELDLAHPLQGIRVMDISRVIAGPCAARILAELGAEVLSVQRPTRLDWALSFHLLFNAGKRSVTLDFSDDEGKRELWAIMEDFQPHAFIQNYRHMELAREIGVGPEALRAKFPKIAYTHLNAYGNLGIWRDRPGFEQVVQAVSGIQMTYGRGGKPKLLPTPVIDIGSGLLGALGTLLGLYQQLKTGESVVATTHLTRMSVLFQVEPIAETQRQRCLETARSRGVEVQDDPSRRVVAGILRALDGFFCVAGPRFHVKTWLQATGLAKSNAPETDNPLDQVVWSVMTRSIAHWRATVERAGLADTVVVVQVPRMKRMLAEFPPSPERSVPAIRRRDFSGVDSQLTFIANPIRLSGTPLADVSPAPMRGEHTVEVMSRLGLRVPEDGGVIPYPAAKPLLVWIATLVRWGYFAWRSGNI